MRGPKLVVDSDHRFTEVLDLSNDEVYQLSDNKSDNVDPDRIARLMYSNMPGSGVQTIVVDSLTAIISPLTIQAMIDKEKGRSKNLMNGFKEKALAMRQLIDGIIVGEQIVFGFTTYMMLETEEPVKSQQQPSPKQRSLAYCDASMRNLRSFKKETSEALKLSGLVVVEVDWYSGMKVETGKICPNGWKQLSIRWPLTQEEQNRIEAKTPMVFQSPQHALSYGVEEGAFQSIEEAQKIYELVKKECQPTNAKEMASFWQAEIRNRKASLVSVKSDLYKPKSYILRKNIITFCT